MQTVKSSHDWHCEKCDPEKDAVVGVGHACMSSGGLVRVQGKGMWTYLGLSARYFGVVDRFNFGGSNPALFRVNSS